VGQAGGNIVEIEHQRMFLDVSARSAELEVVVETIDHAHVERIIAALADVGLMARVGSVEFGPSLT
jgi:threonine dehydratase